MEMHVLPVLLGMRCLGEHIDVDGACSGTSTSMDLISVTVLQYVPATSNQHS